jgi:hypothetical protein
MRINMRITCVDFILASNVQFCHGHSCRFCNRPFENIQFNFGTVRIQFSTLQFLNKIMLIRGYLSEDVKSIYTDLLMKYLRQGPENCRQLHSENSGFTPLSVTFPVFIMCSTVRTNILFLRIGMFQI